jgi:hypothetical protein
LSRGGSSAWLKVGPNTFLLLEFFSHIELKREIVWSVISEKLSSIRAHQKLQRLLMRLKEYAFQD